MALDEAVPIAWTKLRVPSSPRTLSRPRLDSHAESLCAYALTAVSAGAGFGKTTVLRVWADRCRDVADVAWIGFDEGDDGALAVATLLEAALRRLYADFGRSFSPRLARDGFEPDAYARAFSNELLATTEERERDVVIFLDDVHAVGTDGGVRELLGGLLRLLPPRAHVAIASRHPLDFSPIVRLRAEGRVADLGQNDLRFTNDEAAALLTETGVDPTDVTTIESIVRRTDGWAMALRLAAHGARTPAASERNDRPLFSYLADDVFRTQPTDVRDALLACAIPRTFDARTMERLLDVPDGRAIVEPIVARNLYVEALEDRRLRFHNLFRDFLLETLERQAPERLHRLRVRYAQLLESDGDVAGAVAQYVAAGDFIAAADHVAHVQFAIMYGDDVERVAALLRKIPDDVKRERPRLLQFEAMALRRKLDFDGAAEAFARAQTFALELGDLTTALSCSVQRALLADGLRLGGHGTFERSLVLAREALALAERCRDRRDVSLKTASIVLGLVHAARFEYDLAKPHLDRAVALQRTLPVGHNDVLTTVAAIYGWQGDWQKALETAELAEDHIRSSDSSPVIGRALKMQAKAHFFLRDDPERALALAEAAVDAETASNEYDDLADTYVVVAQAQIAQEIPRIDRALAALDSATACLRRWPNRVVAFDIGIARFNCLFMIGRCEDARRELAAARALAEANADPHEVAVATLYEGILSASRGEHARARAHFESALRRFEPLHDRFFHQLCDVAACASAARAGSLEPERLDETLARLAAAPALAALKSAPRSASIVLAAALRRGAPPEHAEALLADAAALGDDADVAELALDESAPAAARVRAIALVARERRASRRGTLARLARDRDVAVSAAAATALNVFPASDVPPLGITLVGPLRVCIGDTVIEERDGRWSRRKAVDMLRALALAGGPVAKPTLIADLWPGGNSAAAETSLRVTLHALRRTLEPDAEGTGNYIEYDGTTIALRREAVASIDALDALGAYKRALFARARKAADEAQTLFNRTIDLLAGVPAEESVPPWLAPHVRAWRETLVGALRSSAQLRLEAGAPAAARLLVERALLVDPLDEDTVRVALDVGLANDDLAWARSIFVAYKRRLADELSATPGPEVLATYGTLLKARSEARTLGLTPREIEILIRIGRGRSNKQIAAELHLSPWTVNGYVTRILRKMRVDSRAAAVAAAGGLLDE